MRHLLFLLVAVTATAPLLGEVCVLPAPFVSLMYERHSGDFYDQQAADWQAIVSGDCSTDEAWWHYYKTATYSNRFGSGKYDLDAILAAAAKVLDPEGFELNYLYFAHDEDLVTRWPHLLKAHQADPDQMEAATGLATYYTINNQLTERSDILQRMHIARAIPIGVMEYNHNQLMSVANKGVLITNGDADTYPAWLLQSAYGIRPDVSIVSLPLLLGFPAYREVIKVELGVDQLFADGQPSAASLLAQLATGERPVFLAATGQHYLDDLPDERLFVSGLAFQYSLTPVDNLGMIANIFTEGWRLENLRQPLADDPAQAVADQLNQNYLPALLELHEYYLANPAPEFRENLKLLQSIAARAGVEERVNAFLRGPEPELRLASTSPGLKAKDIYKQTAFIPAGVLKTKVKPQGTTVNGFFMQEFEVSNADYQLFLEDLLRQRRFDLLDSVAIEQINFKELLSELDLQEKSDELKAVYLADEQPIVNVSHRAAELYALWLTQVYNQDPKRKDERKVKFRLPTEQEFSYAFSGGKGFVPYPWGGPYFRNSKGCYLANFNTSLKVTEKDVFFDFPGTSVPTDPEVRAEVINREGGGKESCGMEEDGGLFTVNVRAYHPNSFGLYNMAGNAAEMLVQPGKTMGGSWYDPAYNMQFGVVTERTQPHPSTGFRLVMVYE